jgi:hypothetical protein
MIKGHLLSKRTQRRARRIVFRSDRPRRIDRYIDFFGQVRGVTSPALALRRHVEAYSEAS